MEALIFALPGGYVGIAAVYFLVVKNNRIGKIAKSYIKKLPRKPVILTRHELNRSFQAEWVDDFKQLMMSSNLHQLLSFSEVPVKYGYYKGGKEWKAICTCGSEFTDEEFTAAERMIENHIQNSAMMEIESLNKSTQSKQIPTAIKTQRW